MTKNFKNISTLLIFGVVIITFLISPIVESAQMGRTGDPEISGRTDDPASFNIKIENPFKKDTIRGFIETIVNDILIPIGSVVAVLMIIYAGFLYVTARGNPTEIQKAHQALLWAVIGAAILLGAWVISEAIQATIDQLRKS